MLNHIKACLIFGLVLLSNMTLLFSQGLRFEQLSTYQGLPSSEVYNLFQDRKGYVWAFTKNGIVKHNGAKFIPSCTNLPNNEAVIYTVRKDHNGIMYIANSKAKIYTIKNDSAHLIHGLEKMSQDIISGRADIYDLLVVSPRKMYFSTFDSTYFFDDGLITNITRQGSKQQVTSYLKWKNQIIAIKGSFQTGNNQPELKDLNTNQVLPLPKYPIVGFWHRHSMKQSPDGSYYILQHPYLIRINNNSNKSIEKILLPYVPLNFEISSTGEVWIGSAHGLFRYDKNLQLIDNNFINHTVSDILFDDQDGAWVATLDQGIYYCKNISQSYYEYQKFSGSISMMKEINGNLFIGTNLGNLFVNERNNWRNVYRDKQEACITDLVLFDNRYLLGTKMGTVVMDSKYRVLPLTPFNKSGSSVLNSYGFAKNHNQSITSISASSVQTLSYQWKQIGKFKISNQKNRCIVLRNPNEYFIGTLSGMYLYNNDTTFVPSYLTPLLEKEISHLSLDSDSNIWVCTRGHGIYLLKKNNQLLPYKNCPAEVVNDLIFINDSLVFIATSVGVFKNTINNLLDKMWQRLTDNETHNLAYLTGKLYLAIESGLLVQDLNLANHESVRKFYLASVIAFDKNIDVNDIRLSHHENNIRFNFDDLTYSSKKKEYAYRLSGPNTDIGKFTGSQLYLQNLSPGYYKLYINAFENNTILDKELIVVSFYIQPAFWQTTIFYILLTLLLISALIFIYKMINASERKKTDALQRLASYKMTAIKAQINPHFVSNSLTSIQQLIMANEIDKANLYLAKFSLLLRYVLQQADKYLTPLAEEIKIMDIIVELEQLRFNEKFIYEKRIHPEINLQQTYVPPLLIQPIVENAI